MYFHLVKSLNRLKRSEKLDAFHLFGPPNILQIIEILDFIHFRTFFDHHDNTLMTQQSHNL